jgi:hypothetical protein
MINIMYKKLKIITVFFILFILATDSSWAQKSVKWHPGHYALVLEHSFLTINTDARAAERFERFVSSLPDEITGIQSGVYWSMLESGKDIYDLSLIEKQLQICAKYKKYLFFTISEKQFDGKNPPVPSYLINEPQYHGGLVYFRDGRGSQARIWDPAVLERFNRLVSEIGDHFDQEPYFEGIEFVETSLNIDYSQENFNPTKYIDALKQRLASAKKAFPSSVILQETNWLPGVGRKEMSDFFEFCRQTGVGIGGPDLIPDYERVPERPRIPAYEFFPQYGGEMPLASDVQPPQYQGKTGNKTIGTLTPKGIYDMGVNTLKLNYIFWGVCDWKNTNFTFTQNVLPYLKQMNGKINTAYPENLKP